MGETDKTYDVVYTQRETKVSSVKAPNADAARRAAYKQASGRGGEDVKTHKVTETTKK